HFRRCRAADVSSDPRRPGGDLRGGADPANRPGTRALVTGERPWLTDPPTEQRNPRTTDIDRLETREILPLINAEDATVPAAVAAALPRLAEAVDLAVAALGAGRRMHYFGAGTSGRLAVIDAAELPPTFGLAADRVVAHLAGGAHALTNPS